MDPLKIYDYLAQARRKVLDWVRPLSAEDYAREFPIGLRSLGRTLAHALSSEWYYVLRIQEARVPPYEEWPIQEEDPPPFATLEAEWERQAARTRTALAAVRDWSRELEYEVTDEGRKWTVNASTGDVFTQLVLHEVHHRAQATAILRQLGVAVADIDYNTIMYKRRDAEPA